MFSHKSDSDKVHSVIHKSNEELGLEYHKVQKVTDMFFHKSCSILNTYEGTFNRSFLISVPLTLFSDIKYIFRFALPAYKGYEKNLYAQQWAASEAILEKFITPRIIATDTTHKLINFDFQVIEYIEGQTLYELRYDEKLVCNILEEVKNELKKIHNLAGDKYGLLENEYNTWREYLDSNFSNHIDYLDKHKLLEPSTLFQIAFVHEENDIKCKPVLLHGDLSYNNIIVKNGKLAAIIDWEDAVFGDPAFEFAGLATFHPERRHKIFVEENPNFWYYYLRIALSKMVHRHKFGYIYKAESGFMNPDKRVELALSKINKK